MKKILFTFCFLISVTSFAGTHYAVFPSSLNSVDYMGSPTWQGVALDGEVNPETIENQPMVYTSYFVGRTNSISKYQYKLRTITQATLISEEFPTVQAVGMAVEAIPLDKPVYAYSYRGNIANCKGTIKVEAGVVGIVNDQISSFAPYIGLWKTIRCPPWDSVLKELYVNGDVGRPLQILDKEIVDSTIQ